jgi:hypothetical protein
MLQPTDNQQSLIILLPITKTAHYTVYTLSKTVFCHFLSCLIRVWLCTRATSVMNRLGSKLHGSLLSSIYTVCTRAILPFTATLLSKISSHAIAFLFCLHKNNILLQTLSECTFKKKTLSECTFKKKHYRSARYKCRLLVVGGGEACAPAGVVEPEDCGPRPPARQEGAGLRGQVGGAGDAPLTWSTKVPRGDGKGDEGKTTGELSPSSGAPRQSTRRRPRQAPNARWRCHGMTGKVATCQRGNPRRKGENEMPRPEWCRATVSRTPCRSAFGCEHTNVVVVPNTPRAARYVRMPLPVAAHEKKARWREAHESISH